MRRLKQLEQENSRLQRAASNLMLEKLILKQAGLFITQGTPGHIRSDNGPEVAAVAVS